MPSSAPRPQDIARLRDKTSCSAQDCARALQEGEGSLLSALLLLEADCLVTAPNHGDTFSTKDQDGLAGFSGLGDFPDFERNPEDGWDGESFYQMLRQEVLANHLCLWAGSRRLVRVPVLLILLLFPISYGTVLPLSVIPMFFGIEYRFSNEGSFLAELNPILRRSRNALSIFGRIFGKQKKNNPK